MFVVVDGLLMLGRTMLDNSATAVRRKSSGRPFLKMFESFENFVFSCVARDVNQ